jgi:Panthothenate synthetase
MWKMHDGASVGMLRQTLASMIERLGLKGEYVEVFRPSDISIVTKDIKPGDYCCLAAYCGDVRLIDNMMLF